MPYRVRYKPLKRSRENWAIINKDTGRIVGRSTSEKKAEASARARLAGEHGWRSK